jgi:hypothetical protein
VGFYRITIESSAKESDSLAEESVVFRQFFTRFIFRSILEYLDNTWFRGTIDMSCFGNARKRNDFGKEYFGDANRITHAYTLQIIS